jgi:tetratricopeptide (TPR) repeat protein
MEQKMNRKKTLIILSLFFVYTFLYSAFKDYLGSARTVGICGAYTAVSDDTLASFYNPAGLGQITRMELISSYGRYYVGGFGESSDNTNLSEGSLAFSLPYRHKGLNLGTFSFSVNYFSLIGVYNENTFRLMYGKKLTGLLYLGGGLKLFNISYAQDEYSSINPVFRGGNSKTSFGLDLGIMSFIKENIVVGMKFENINQPDLGLKYTDVVPIKISLAASYKLRFLTTATEVYFQDKDVIWLTGLEGILLKSIKLRGGFGLGNRNFARISFGAGYEIRNMFFDWGFYLPVGSIQKTFGTHMISFGYRFGGMSISEESQKKISLLYEELKSKILDGKFKDGLDVLNKILDITPYDKKYQHMNELLSQIVKYLAEVEGKENYHRALKVGVYKYLIDEQTDKAVEYLIYAMTTTPDDKLKTAIDKVVRFISKQEGIEYKGVVPGWSLVEQKLYKSLEHLKNKKYDECIKLCEEVLELEENNITALKRIGSCYYILGDLNKAKYYWQKSVETAPEDEENKKIKEILEKMK